MSKRNNYFYTFKVEIKIYFYFLVKIHPTSGNKKVEIETASVTGKGLNVLLPEMAYCDCSWMKYIGALMQ